MAIVHVTDDGTEYEVDFVEDISNFSAMSIVFQKPDLSLISQTGTLVVGSTTKGECTLAAADHDQNGPWQIEGVVTTPDGSWSSIVGHFVVQNVLEDGVKLVN